MRWRIPVVVGVGVVSLGIVLGVTQPWQSDPQPGPVGMEATASSPSAVPSAAPEPSSAGSSASPSASEEPQQVSVTAIQKATIGAPVVVASFNVCKVSCDPPAPSWDIRRDRVARVISESGADVVGLQEATNNPTTTAKTQADDIINMMAPAGYRAPTYPIEANECRRPRDANGQLAGPSPCDNTALLLFKAATVQQVTLPSGQPSAGVLLSSSIAPGIDPLSAARSVMWAYLQGPGTKPFLAIAMHTDSSKTPEVEASRVAVANALGPWADAWNAAHGMSGAPVLLMADLNSYAKRQPNGAQKALTSNGWTDAYEAPTKRNTQYSTINYNPLLAVSEQGFPAKPYQFRSTKKNPDAAATRIDYIMTWGGKIQPLDYEVVIRLNGDGSFNQDYQASDHQMIRSTLLFPPA